MAIDTAKPAPARLLQRNEARYRTRTTPRTRVPWLDETTLHAATHNAVHELAEQAPHFSAHTVIWWHQALWLVIAASAVTGFAVVLPSIAWLALMTALAVPFACLAIFRAAAIVSLVLTRKRETGQIASTPDDALPTYTVLVPLYEEANMAQQIVEALLRLDYPAEKLEILILLEAHDHRTRAAFAALAMPGHFHLLVVPRAAPQTKPKALDVALAFATGDYVVVYDAEDLPDPDQLRQAVAAFADAPKNVACLQARLLIHNTR
ncbi:MAG: glycosyltransferase, partial [Hyphomicrobiaceae bacterium]